MLDYATLDRRATRIAGELQETTTSGDRALQLCEIGPEFIAGFFGCACAAVVPVPAAVPHARRDHVRLARRREGLAVCRAPVEICSNRFGIDLSSGRMKVRRREY